MYASLPAFVLAFHGCDQSVVEDVVNGRAPLRHSTNDYDWLGHGAYFWENDPSRALAYAQILHQHPNRGRGRVTQPAVLGAVIDLGRCLNLMDSEALELLRTSYGLLSEAAVRSGGALPRNASPLRESQDLLLRHLDCAVIEFLHQRLRETGERPYDTVRGLFFEGDDLYENAGFREKNHIQICVRNPNCIKGFFVPRPPDPAFTQP